jgi:uncharacterized damage-inducible protein DinB
MTDMLLRQMRHDVWATERLIAHLRKLSATQLELTATGTYGTIRNTLKHIVGADENYVVRLLGAKLHDTPFAAIADPDLDEIAAHLGHVKDGVERLFAKGAFDGDRLITDTPLRRPEQPRIEMSAWVPAAQFINHGTDHRSQIDTILSTQGLESVDLQVWPYAGELNATREAK